MEYFTKEEKFDPGVNIDEDSEEIASPNNEQHVGGEPSAGTLDNRIYNDTGTSGISRSGGPLNGEKQGVCQGGCSIKDITTVKSTTITFQCGKSITRDLCVKCQKLPCTEDCPDCGRNCQAQ